MRRVGKRGLVVALLVAAVSLSSGAAWAQEATFSGNDNATGFKLGLGFAGTMKHEATSGGEPQAPGDFDMDITVGGEFEQTYRLSPYLVLGLMGEAYTWTLKSGQENLATSKDFKGDNYLFGMGFFVRGQYEVLQGLRVYGQFGAGGALSILDQANWDGVYASLGAGVWLTGLAGVSYDVFDVMGLYMELGWRGHMLKHEDTTFELADSLVDVTADIDLSEMAMNFGIRFPY